MRVTNEQIEEWKDSHVVRTLLAFVEAEIEALESARGVTVYHPFEPQKTQEVLAGLNGAYDTWHIVANLLQGDWSHFEEEDDGEQ